ncbi:MAG: AAA family ATPase [Deltaproteobacteria bacterium]|jgi:uncharacterized protein YhaN|nr:AAA family ATPase [Deltaproteobacteria bacterium]
MFIRSFRIERFGVLREQSAPDLSPGLNIFLGDNEAGKSTLLRFFRAMFFGYLRGRSSLDYGREPGPAGGSLELETGQGLVFSLARRPGAQGGQAHLTGAQGPLPESLLPSLLSGYNAALYDQVFCFSLDDLSRIAGLEDTRVSGVLHAAAFGSGFKSPTEVLNELASRRKELFSARALKPLINQRLHRLDEISAELRLEAEVEQYNSLRGEEEETLDALKAGESALAALRERFQRNHALLGVWDEWARLRQNESELRLNPRPEGEFRADGQAFLDAAAEDIREKKAVLAAKRLLREKILAELEREEKYRAPSLVWPDCQSLQARRGSLEAALAGVPALRRDMARLEVEQMEAVRRLGPDWNERKALEFEDSLLLRHELGEFRRALAQGERSLDLALNEAERLRAEWREAEAGFEALAGARRIQADYNPTARAALERCAAALRQGEGVLEQAQVRMERLEEKRAEKEAEAVLLRGPAPYAAGVSGYLGRAAKNLPWLLLCLVLALVCLAESGAFLLRIIGGDDAVVNGTYGTLEHLRQNWPRLLLGLGAFWGALCCLDSRVVPGFSGRALRSAQGALLAEQALLKLEHEASLARAALEEAGRNRQALSRLWGEAVAPYALAPDTPPEKALRIFDLAAGAGLRAARATAAAHAVERAEAAMDSSRDAWTQWLKGRGFAPGFDPETVLTALSTLGEIKKRRGSLEETTAQLKAAEEEIALFTSELHRLLDLAGLPEESVNGAALLELFNRLYNAASAAQAEILRLRQQRETMAVLEGEILETEALLAAREESLAALLQQGCATDEQDYRLRLERYAAYARLAKEQEGLLASLRRTAALIPPGGKAPLWEKEEDFFAALREVSPETLREQDHNLGAALREAEEEEKARHRRLGEIKRGLEALSRGGGQAHLRLEENALRDELRLLARRWGVYVMAEEFILRARRKFEEERHDSVIRLAGEHLERMTGGAYRQVFFDLDGKNGFKVRALSSAGPVLEAESALSRGTREQLYLALRLAFIRQHNVTKESLPMIMDDIMVNFDRQRAENTAALLAEFSGLNQMFFFTCHDQTARTLRRLAPQAVVRRLEGGRIVQED